MKSVIRQIYDGDPIPYEMIQPHSDEYRELRKAFVTDHEGFGKKLKALSAELFRDWEQIDTQRCYLGSMQSEECFYEGVRMGASLMAEVFFGGL